MKIQIDNEERNATAEEIALIDFIRADAAKQKEDKSAARQAVLTKLGLTADEVTALLS